MNLDYLAELKNENDNFVKKSKGMTLFRHSNYGVYNIVLIPVKSQKTFYPALDIRTITDEEDLFNMTLALKALYALRLYYNWIDRDKLEIDDFVAYNVGVFLAAFTDNNGELYQ